MMQYHAKKWFNNASVNAMAAVAIGAMLIFSVVGAKAFADTIENTIAADVTKNTIVEGGSTTATYYVQVQSGINDPQNACNAGDATPLTFSINFPSGVTATVGGTEKNSPFDLTFTKCGEDNGQQVTFSSNTAGSYPITTNNIKDSGTGTYTDNSDFTLTVTEPAAPEDETAPVITADIAGTKNGDWYITDVTVSWTVVEEESPDSLQTTGCDTTTITTDTTGTDITCSATSDGGESSETVTIKRDATKPEITVNSDISNGQEFYFGDVPSEPTCDATDATSGVDGDGCQVSGYGTAVGSYTLKFTANDNAGNTETQEITYTVLPWTIKGFYQPVDMNSVSNLVKAGSTVPLKFEVFKGSTELTDISVRDTVTQKKVTCDTGAPVDEIEQYTTTGQTTFRYDSSSGQFIDNWKSPTTKNACYQVTMTFDDGSSVAALFRTK